MKPQYQLVFSTMCQRLSMGTFVMSVVAMYLFGIALPLNVIALATIVLLGVGMLGTMTHLGKPGRFLNSFANLHSHLTQEAIVCFVVGITYLLLGFNGFFYEMPAGVYGFVLAIAAIASLVFIWISAITYQMGSRPAWNTQATSVNFILTFLAIGTIGAYFFAALFGVMVPISFYVLMAVLAAAALAGQIIFVNHVKGVGYGVDINPLASESKPFFLTWVWGSIVIPVVLFLLLAVMPLNMPCAALLAISEAVGLLGWQAFFFTCGKEVWYFPQYEKDLSPNYF